MDEIWNGEFGTVWEPDLSTVAGIAEAKSILGHDMVINLLAQGWRRQSAWRKHCEAVVKEVDIENRTVRLEFADE